MGYFRELRFETKYLFEELMILIKHPDRQLSRIEVKLHIYKIFRLLTFDHARYCLKRGIRNLWVWFPIIWKNDCWDHTYLTELMDKQMKEMEEFFLSGTPMSMRAKRDGKRIRWARKLYKLWKDEYYVMTWYDYHNSKFPHENMWEIESTQYDSYGIPISYQTKSMTDEESEHYRSGSTIAHKKDEKVFKLYMKNLAYLRNWWD